MKVKNLLFCTLFFCCALGIQTLNAQLVEKATITGNEANFKMISPNSYLMEIAGPNDYYFRQEIEFTGCFSNGRKSGATADRPSRYSQPNKRTQVWILSFDGRCFVNRSAGFSSPRTFLTSTAFVRNFSSNHKVCVSR